MQRPSLSVVVVAAGFALIVAACSASATSVPTAAPTASPSATPISLPSAEPTAPPATASPSPSAPPTAAPSTGSSLEGTWNGTWQDTSPDQASGSFSLTWTQNGDALTGNITVKGTPCVGVGTVSGTVTGSTITFGAVSGKNTVSYTGTISGSTMKGSYSAPDACENAQGTWSASK